MPVINIVDDGDLIVELTVRPERNDDTYQDHAPPPLEKVQFRVTKDILTKTSSPLRAIIHDFHRRVIPGSVTSIGEGLTSVTELWLRVLHKVELIYEIEVPHLWHLAQAIDYYELNIPDFYPWFATWYQKMDAEELEPRQLLYPTWRFDHAKGFARWTKHLAYKSVGHITESNPTRILNYHLPPRLIQQLNAAKGRLKTVLFNGLWRPCDALLKSRCPCKEKTMFNYVKHLTEIRVWPLEIMFRSNTMADILERLENFSYEPPKGACGQCKQDYKGMASRLQDEVLIYFDGLCLDCLDRSKPKVDEDSDLDYWCYVQLKEDEFCRHCRFRHKQPTWYFSFHGRKEDRDRLIKEKRVKRRRDS